MAGVLLFATAGVSVAQGPPGRDYHNAPPGHGGVPPGHSYDHGHDRGPSRHEDWHFQEQDRQRFYSHYQKDANRWRGRKRPRFVRGQVIPRGYSIQPVPQSYWRGAPPPPVGYQYGYYDGYVVAYDPTSRMIADVIDLVAAAAFR